MVRLTLERYFKNLVRTLVKISVGKLRGIQQLSSTDGFLMMIAMDQRGSLAKMLNPANPDSVSFEQMVEAKLDLSRILAPHGTAVLHDPEFGASQSITRFALPGNVGLLVAVETTGYKGSSTSRLTEIVENWGVEKVKRMSASAVKLLLYYRPDEKDSVGHQRKLVKQIGDDCKKYDVPFVLEPMSYALEGEDKNSLQFADMKPKIVIQTAKELTPLGVDILKSEFPGDLKFHKDPDELIKWCKEISNATCVPWVVLSAGVKYEEFRENVIYSSKGGCSGYLAGRAIWQEAVKMPTHEERVKFLKETSIPRLKELQQIVRANARPWYDFYGGIDKIEVTTKGWHKEY